MEAVPRLFAVRVRGKERSDQTRGASLIETPTSSQNMASITAAPGDVDVPMHGSESEGEGDVIKPVGFSDDSSEEEATDEEAERKIREGFIVDEDSDAEEEEDEAERRRRKRHKKRHRKQGEIQFVCMNYSIESLVE